MDITGESRFKEINTIGIWLIVLILGGWLLFKPDNNLTKDTVEKLTSAVDKIAVASNNLNEVAKSQREWFAEMQRDTELSKSKREGDYNAVYNNYGYDSANNNLSLNDIYDRRLHEQAEGVRRSDVRGLEDTTGKTGSVQEYSVKPKG